MTETVITVRVEEQVKQEAEAALAPFGLTADEFLLRAVERLTRHRDDDLAWRAFHTISAVVDVESGDARLVRPDLLRGALQQLVKDDAFRSVLSDVLDESLVPNAETVEAIEAARRGEFVGEFKTVEELNARLNADD